MRLQFGPPIDLTISALACWGMSPHLEGHYTQFWKMLPIMKSSSGILELMVMIDFAVNTSQVQVGLWGLHRWQCSVVFELSLDQCMDKFNLLGLWILYVQWNNNIPKLLHTSEVWCVTRDPHPVVIKQNVVISNIVDTFWWSQRVGKVHCGIWLLLKIKQWKDGQYNYSLSFLGIPCKYQLCIHK